ncbi:RNA polymerase sigma factor [Streptomyces avermitilis]|uniref:RNA polymerase sigma factor n=1 Tax=Streptomyces avermitilis TaxID=33903 RepID=UPI0037F29E98
MKERSSTEVCSRSIRSDSFSHDSSIFERSLTDPQEFVEIYDRYASQIYRYALLRLGDELVDEAVARIFLTAFRRRSFYSSRLWTVRTWLYGITNGVISSYRRQEIMRYRTMAHDESMHFTGDAWTVRRIATTLGALPRKQRDAYLLVAWGSLSLTEAAQALGIPTTQLQTRFDRASQRMAAALTVDLQEVS